MRQLVLVQREPKARPLRQVQRKIPVLRPRRDDIVLEQQRAEQFRAPRELR
ncbi:hypothetical protein D3C72_2064040 [compost metagenome]